MAEKKRPLFFAYDPAAPTDINVWYSIGDRSSHFRRNAGWTNANLADVTRMAKKGLFDTFVVHTPESCSRRREAPLPTRIGVSVSLDFEQVLDLVRQMGGAWEPPQPKPKLQVPFDHSGNQLHRGPRRYHRYSNTPDSDTVVWKENHEFIATMTFGAFVYGGSAASYIHLKDEHGNDFQMFLNGLEKAIHHVNKGKLSGKFEFCRRGESFGVKFLESQEDMERKLDKRLEGDVKPTQMRW